MRVNLRHEGEPGQVRLAVEGFFTFAGCMFYFPADLVL